MKALYYANAQWAEIPHDGRLDIRLSDNLQKFRIYEKDGKLHVSSQHCRPILECDGNRIIIEDKYVKKNAERRKK